VPPRCRLTTPNTMLDDTRQPLIALALLTILFPASPLHPRSPGASPRPAVKILGSGQLLSLNDNGFAVGGAFTYDNGKQGSIVRPLGKGQNTNLFSVNDHGQILLAQKLGPLRYFIYDPGQKTYTPIGLAGQVTQDGTPKTIQIAYLTGLDDDGRVYTSCTTRFCRRRLPTPTVRSCSRRSTRSTGLPWWIETSSTGRPGRNRSAGLRPDCGHLWRAGLRCAPLTRVATC
jgi:hypothetical protein